MSKVTKLKIPASSLPSILQKHLKDRDLIPPCSSTNYYTVVKGATLRRIEVVIVEDE